MSDNSKASLLTLPPELFNDILGRLDRTSLVSFCGTHSDVAEAISNRLHLGPKSFGFFSEEASYKALDRLEDPEFRNSIETIWLFSLPGKYTETQLNRLYEMVNPTAKHDEGSTLTLKKEDTSANIPVCPNATKLHISLDTLTQLAKITNSSDKDQTTCFSLDLCKWLRAKSICISWQELQQDDAHGERVGSAVDTAGLLLQTTFNIGVPKNIVKPVNIHHNSMAKTTTIEMHLHGLGGRWTVPSHIAYTVYVDYMQLHKVSQEFGYANIGRARCMAVEITRRLGPEQGHTTRYNGVATVLLSMASPDQAQELLEELMNRNGWESNTRVESAWEKEDCPVCHLKI